MRSVSKISSSTFLIGRHTCHRCVYILWLALICTVFWRLIYFIDLYAQFLGFSMLQWTCLYKVSGFGKFVIKWSSNTHLKHLFYFWPLRLLHLLLELRELKGSLLYTFYFLCCLKYFSVECEPPQWLHFDWGKISTSLFLTESSKFK